MLKLVVLALIAVASAQDIIVCRNGQTITIPITLLSPYDEFGSCRVSDYFIPPTEAPANPMPNPATTATAAPTSSPTSAPSASTPMPSSVSSSAPSSLIPSASPVPTSSPNSLIPISSPSIPSSVSTSAPSSLIPSAAPTMVPASTILQTATATHLETLGPNAIVPDQAVTPSPIVLPITEAPVAPMLQTSTPNPVETTAHVEDATLPTAPATLPPNDMPTSGRIIVEPVVQNVTATSSHQDHEDVHDWQATGSFSHGHMTAVMKSKNRVLPSNLDPNDPRSRVLVFLQWFSSQSVYENPQQVFVFFTKLPDAPSQRSMRIN